MYCIVLYCIVLHCYQATNLYNEINICDYLGSAVFSGGSFLGVISSGMPLLIFVLILGDEYKEGE